MPLKVNWTTQGKLHPYASLPFEGCSTNLHAYPMFIYHLQSTHNTLNFYSTNHSDILNCRPHDPNQIPILQPWKYSPFIKTSVAGFLEAIFQSYGLNFNFIVFLKVWSSERVHTTFNLLTHCHFWLMCQQSLKISIGSLHRPSTIVYIEEISRNLSWMMKLQLWLS